MLLELDYAQAYAADKESVDAEGVLIAPAAATVEELSLAALDLAFLPNTEIMSDAAAINWSKSAPRYSPTCRTTVSMP